MYIKKILVLLFLITASMNAAEELTIDYDAGPQAQCVLEIAQFRLWAADKNNKLNGVIIVLPGVAYDGRKMINNKAYRDLAKKHNFALMSCFLRMPRGKPPVYQLDIKGNTSLLLNKVLDEFAKKSSKAEISSVPLVLFGISAGGNIAVQYPNKFYKRTIGSVAYVPTIGPGENIKEKKAVPMLIVSGAKDPYGKGSDHYWNAAKGNSIWCLAKHKELGHTSRYANGLGIAYADAVISQRLNVKQEQNAKKTTLKDIDYNTGWLGNLASYEITKIVESNEKDQNFEPNKAFNVPKGMVWLPNKKVAEEWHKYLTRSFKKVKK